MKRVTYWPQIVLGFAFSWGALMGWPATFGRLDWPALVLYAGSIAWVIGYDTIYAHQDREDDALIGIKSTALLFGENTRPMLAVFYTLAVALMALAGWGAGAGIVFSIGLLAFAAHLSWQIRRLDIGDPDLCCGVQVEPRRGVHSVRGAGARRAAWAPLAPERLAQFRAMISRSPRCTVAPWRSSGPACAAAGSTAAAS